MVRQLRLGKIPWSVRPVAAYSPFIREELDEWNPDAVLMQTDQEVALEWCRTHARPYVLLLGGKEERQSHALTASVDDHAVGRMAAEYFLARGYRHFAFVGNGNWAFSLERRDGFEGLVRAHNRKVFDFIHSTPEFDPQPKRRILYQGALAEWLGKLPKPVAILGGNDREALDIVQACAEADIAIPREVSLLGTGDDRLICQLCTPEISSVKLPFARIGSEAIKMLLRSLKPGSESKFAPIVQPPVTILTRGSSDAFDIKDPVVKEASRMMQQEIAHPLKIHTILDKLGVSRPNLERRFREEFGRTPLVEMRRLRIEKSKMLLADTRLTNAEIAARSGFSSNIRFITVFKQIVGQTPAAYREKLQYEE
jgi:LacI family transcriptional regulator